MVRFRKYQKGKHFKHKSCCNQAEKGSLTNISTLSRSHKEKEYQQFLTIGFSFHHEDGYTSWKNTALNSYALCESYRQHFYDRQTNYTG